MILWIVSVFGLAGELCFAVFAIASGLYYLAELIEEYTVIAKRVITYLLLFILVLYVCLLVDGFPVAIVAVGFFSHVCYGSLLTTYPVISLCSFGFLGGTVLLAAAHFLTFQYFATEWHTFQEIIGFFFVCLWMVPFSIFISLSANDLVLPTLGGTDTHLGAETGRSPRRSGFLALFDVMATKMSTLTPSRTSKSS